MSVHHMEIEPGDENLLIKPKKLKKVKKQLQKAYDDVLLEVVERDSFEEYEKDVLDWRDLHARIEEESD